MSEIAPQKRLAVAQALAPDYEVLGKGRFTLLQLCQEAWKIGAVPMMHGRQGIGKSGVIIPYLRSFYPDLIVMEPGAYDDEPLSERPDHLVGFMSLSGEGRRNQARQQRHYIATQYGLPEDFRSMGGEVLIHTSADTIKKVAHALYSDHPHFSEGGLHHWRWAGSFHQIADELSDNSRPYTLRPAIANVQGLAEESEFFRKRVFGFF